MFTKSNYGTYLLLLNDDMCILYIIYDTIWIDSLGIVE